MTMFPDTTRRLLEAGHNPQPLERAAMDNFMAVGRHEKGHLERGAIYAPDVVTEGFWRVFCEAARVLRGGETKREAA